MLESKKFYIDILNSDSDIDKKMYAIRKLRNFREEDVSLELLPYLSDENPMVRYLTVQTLGETGLKNNSQFILEALAEPEDWVRIAVVEAIGKIKPENATEFLIRYLENEKDNKVKATIIKILGLFNDENIIPYITEFLNSQDERIRANTIEALENFEGNRKILDILSEFKKDSNNRVRANTAMVLIRHGEKEGFSILEEMLKEKDEWMTASGVYGLGEIGTSQCLDILLKNNIDKRKEWSIRRNFIIALGKFCLQNIPEADSHIKNILESSDEEEVIYMIRIISEYRLKRYIDIISAKLYKASGELREKIEEAIDILVEN